MVKYCSNCGEKLENENSKFCSKCGQSLNPTNNQNQENTQGSVGFGQINCPFCGKVIPSNVPKCMFCGHVINAEDHKTAIIIGYIGTLFIPLIGIIDGIYLLTRDNKEVHKHGVFMLIEAIIVWFITFMILMG